MISWTVLTPNDKPFFDTVWHERCNLRDACGLEGLPCLAVWLIFVVFVINTCTFSQKRLPKKSVLCTPISRVTSMPTKLSQPAFCLDRSSIQFLTHIFFCSTGQPQVNDAHISNPNAHFSLDLYAVFICTHFNLNLNQFKIFFSLRQKLRALTTARHCLRWFVGSLLLRYISVIRHPLWTRKLTHIACKTQVKMYKCNFLHIYEYIIHAIALSP